MSDATLIGGATLGYDSLLEDIRVTEQLAGFRHYLDQLVGHPGQPLRPGPRRIHRREPACVDQHLQRPVQVPGDAVEPTPRVGIREAVGGHGSLTVRWDVALDSIASATRSITGRPRSTSPPIRGSRRRPAWFWSQDHRRCTPAASARPSSPTRPR